MKLRNNITVCVVALVAFLFAGISVSYAAILTGHMQTPAAVETPAKADVDKAVENPGEPNTDTKKLASNEGLEMVWKNSVQERFLAERSDNQLIVLPANIFADMNDDGIKEIVDIVDSGNYGVSIAAESQEQISQVINRFVGAGLLRKDATAMDLLQNIGIPVVLVTKNVFDAVSELFKAQGVAVNCILNNLTPAIIKAYKEQI